MLIKMTNPEELSEEIDYLYEEILVIKNQYKQSPEDCGLHLKLEYLNHELSKLEEKEADEYDKALEAKLELPFGAAKEVIKRADELLKKYYEK